MKQVIIIGSGIAGMTAAIKAAENQMQVTMISPKISERSQSVMAMGGINAALNTKGQSDSTNEHYQDTQRSGMYLANPKAVEGITTHAPEVVKWLVKLGVAFNRTPEGEIDLRYFGGQKKMRTAYAGASTGKQIVSALVERCRYYECKGNIKHILNAHFLTPIVDKDNNCHGAIYIKEHTGEVNGILGDAVILATGGANSIFGKTTGSRLCDGSAVGAAYLKGAALANEEFIQYHPTTIETPSKRMLMTEAARGEGGILWTIKDGKPWRFMKEWYPEAAELMPRDVVSKAIYKVCQEMGLGIDGKNQVYLDITRLSKETIDEKLDELVNICTTYTSIDVYHNPIPVYPGIHYFMGGLYVDENHNTTINRVYGIGECAAQYHGANRLGGNSLLGATYSGIKVIETINKKIEPSISDTGILEETLDEERLKIKKLQLNTKGYSVIHIENKLAQIMNESMGIVRNESRLKKGYSQLKDLYKRICEKGVSCGTDYYGGYRIYNMLMLGMAMIASALERKESRGAHIREDYPDLNNEQYLRTTVARYDKDQGAKITFEPIMGKE